MSFFKKFGKPTEQSQLQLLASLESVDTATAIPKLIPMLSDASPFVRRGAAEMISHHAEQFGGSGEMAQVAIPHLIPL